MLTLDKIEVRLSFLPVITSSGKDRHTVSLETRERIWEKISEGIPADNSDQQRLKSSQG